MTSIHTQCSKEDPQTTLILELKTIEVKITFKYVKEIR